MSKYTDYFDRQTPSGDLHRRLLAIPRPKRRVCKPCLAAAAACCVLALGLCLWQGLKAPAVRESPSQLAAPPVESAAPAPTDGSTVSTEPPLRQLPALHYSETGAGAVAADIAPPEGWFQEDLTQEDLAALFGSAGWWEDLGWSLEGRAMYDGYGQLWQVCLAGQDGGDNWFSLGLAPDRLPPTCIVTEPENTNDIWGTEVSASRCRYDCDGDGVEEYRYEISFLRDETLGARLELTSEADAQGLIDAILARLLDPDRAVSLDFLVPAEIPQWRSENLTWEEALQEPDFAAYVPRTVPEGFRPESFHLEMGQGRCYMNLLWCRGYDGLDITIDREPDRAYYGDFLADPALPESYDVRLYAIPWGETVPDAFWYTIQDPVFRAEDVTRELLEARELRVSDRGDSDSPRFQFQILYPDGVLVSYRAEMELDSLWALIEPTLP